MLRPHFVTTGFIRVATAIVIVLLAAAPALTASSCGGGATVIMKDLKFEPQEVTIKQGEAVTWKNEDRRNRQIMSGAPPVMTDKFVSPVLERGQSWSFTFDDPGEFPFHDMVVPGLLGIVVVEE